MNRFSLQNSIFKLLLVCFFGLLAWQSTLHFKSFDWSKNQRNSLTEDSIRLLSTFEKPLKFLLFASPLNENLGLFNDLLKRYQYHQDLIEIEIINPDLAPELLREYDIRQEGVLVIEFEQKTEKIVSLTERNISNALQRLARQSERWVVFLEGHGERHPYGDANHDISSFSAQLASKGFIVESLNLSKVPTIPSNTQVLVIASPQTELLSGEKELIIQYVQNGGNLLWLAEPEQSDALSALAELLNFEFLKGVVVDQNSQLLGLDRVDYALISEYPIHPITEFIDSIAIFPQSAALFFNNEDDAPSPWKIRPFLNTQANSWTETGTMQGQIVAGDNSDEALGPLSIGLTFNREIETEKSMTQQRVAVIGDGDFLSNQFLGNGANAELGFNLINWLSHDDNLIAINAKAAPDTTLELSETQKIILAVGFLMLLPVLLLFLGLRIWLKRKNR